MSETLDLPTREEARAGGANEIQAKGTDSRLTGRAEVDTSTPFESVREAVDRFGGSAVWKLQLKQLFAPEKHHCFEDDDLMSIGEQTSKLEMDLIMKERETLDVLKELETTKRIMDELKLKLQKETTGITSDNIKVHPILDTGEQHSKNPENHMESIGPSIAAKQPPGLILMELKQAKLNLNRTTSDLAGIHASIELLNSKIEAEKVLIEKTREKLNSNSAKVSSLEGDLNRTALEIQRIKDAKCKGFENSSNMLSQIEQLNSEKEQFMKMTEDAISVVLKLTAEIEQTKAFIKAAEIRCLAANKMEEAAKASETVALSKIKALTGSENSLVNQNSSEITLPDEEYAKLTRKAQEVDEISRNKIEGAVLQVEEANRSKQDLLMKVEEATAEVETSMKALEEALKREEDATRGKLEVEAALQSWRSEPTQKRRSVHNPTKFKNSYPTHHRRDSWMLDVNGLSLTADGSRSPLEPTLSIGQILSRKLMGPEEYGMAMREKINGKSKASLGQILDRRPAGLSSQRAEADDGTAHKQFSAKRRKFGFAGFSLQFAKQNKKNKKKKRQAWHPQIDCTAKVV